MPFTLSHPAAVMPLCWRLHYPGIMSALVIGSMAPDFVYWLPLPIARDTSHTVLGLLTFCMPAGFVVFCLYHLLLKPPLLAMLPRAILARLESSRPIPWRLRVIVPVLFALVLGAFTHIVWDAFTHYDTPLTRLWPFLQTPLLTQGRYVLPLYKFLQYFSTVLGFSVLALYGWHWYRCTPPRTDVHYTCLARWQKMVLVTCLIVPAVIGAIWVGLYKASWEVSLGALRDFVVSGVIAGLGIFGLALTALGLLWPWVERQTGSTSLASDA